jgi:predicted permease
MDSALKYVVEPDYLTVMGIPLQRGRFFTAQDNEHSPLVVAIDEVLANRYFHGENPIGKRLYIDDFDPDPAEIVGVVGHVKQWGLGADDDQSVRAQVYLPFMQTGDNIMKLTPRSTRVVVRSSGLAPGMFEALRKTSAEMSSQQVLYAPESMEQIIAGSLTSERFSMVLLGSFAGLALLLASVGIYGVISYVVGERTREMGIRAALGAQHGDILRLILRQSGTLTAAGVALGLFASFALVRLTSSHVFGLRTSDPLTFLAVAVLLSVVALGASYVPAWRATKVDPMMALRYE